MNRIPSTGLLFFIPSLLLVTRSSSTASTQSLRFVQILFRHGDRNPNRPWGPQDPNPESVWPQGWGQLTNLGKAQLYQLGEQTKRRYAGFLSEDYKNEEIYVRSTGRDRALMSAQCFLAGLYPVNSNDRWSETVNWQPIPIHSKTIVDDWIMRCTKACPETTDYYLKNYYRTSQSIADYITANRDFIEYVTKCAGLFTPGDDVKNMKKMWKLGGNLHIARRYNKTLPTWATDDVIDTLTKLRFKKFESQASSSPELTKLSGGPILGHILNNLVEFANGTLFPDDHGQKESGDSRMKDLKLMVFSGHDTNMVFLLSALDLFTPAFWPSYAATLFLELHQIQGSDFIRIFYQDGVDADLTELQIPGCDSPCALPDLLRKSQSMAVWSREEFESLCIKDPSKPSLNRLADLVSAELLFVLAICLSLVGAVTWNRKRSDGSKLKKPDAGGEKSE